MRSNLLQLEFFHVGWGDLRSSNDEIRESAMLDSTQLALAGVALGSSLKTTVRLHDESGLLTRLAVATEKDEARAKAVRSKVTDGARGFQLWRLNRESRKLARRALRIRRAALDQSFTELSRAIKHGREVGIECIDRTFRLLRDNEGHELAERLSRAKGVWVFVFKPNAICTDTNTMIAHIT